MFRHMTAMLCCLAFAAGAEAQSLPSQIVLQVKTQWSIVSDGKRKTGSPCTERWRYTFRAGRIFEEMTHRLCEGSQIQYGQEGVGAVYEPNGTTTRTRHCAQKSGSKIFRCSDGTRRELDMADELYEWTHNFTATSRVTDRLLEFEEIGRGDTVPFTRMIAIRYSGSGCELARYTRTSLWNSTYRIDGKASDCKIVW